MEKRLYYLDNLRVFLTMLVLFHHTSITYGGSGSWYYVEETGLSIRAIILTLFTGVNQAFFMGLFFFISGYFTTGSYNTKGPYLFIKDRLLRLGVPLLFYFFFIGPALIYYLNFRHEQNFKDFYIEKILTMNIVDFGPLWFVEALIYFAIGYVIWRKFKGNKSILNSSVSIPLPSNRIILLAALLTGCASFLIRLIIPVGEEVLGLQLGYFSSYIVLFIAGIMAYKYNWLGELTMTKAAYWFRIALLFIPILPIGLIFTGVFEENHSAGGLNMQAFIYAFWEPFVGFGFCMFLLARFRQYLNRTGPLLKKLSSSAYTVYIIHPPVIVFVSLLLKEYPMLPIIKFLIVGSVGTAACFILAQLILKIPYARHIL